MRVRTLLRLTLSATLTLAPLGNSAFAANPDVTFELRPHCVESDHAAAENTFGGDVPEIDGIMTLTQESALPCPEFAVRDPLSRQTEPLKIGDTLDMDLIMHNPSGLPLQRFRVWIGYDSNVLEGIELTIADAFPTPTPGESDFSIADNYIKVSGATDQAVNGTKIVLARIIIKVKTAPTIGAALSFYDPNGTSTAHSGAFTGEGDTEENVASTVQGSLAIRMQSAAASAASSSAAPVASSGASSISSAALAPVVSSVPPLIASSAPASSAASSVAAPIANVFAKLQVQALRVTTEGSSAFLAWNPLPSAELAGYNLYYGSISGKYLQRRSIDRSGQTATIRALPVGQTYYFAVRAVNGSGEESDFSQEVAVTIGNPATSTSPLSGALIDGGPQGNSPDTNGTVSGDSGPGTWLMIFAAASAIMGTLLAFRRQWTATSTLTR